MGDLNANEMLVKDFKEKFKVIPTLLDCRNKVEAKTKFSDLIDIHARKLYPQVNFVRADTVNAKEIEEKEAAEPKLLPKKDDGCSLI